MCHAQSTVVIETMQMMPALQWALMSVLRITTS
jgi:hypothetical protein